MAFKCVYKQPGHKVCAEHMLTKDGVRFRFRRQMQDVLSIDELRTWHEIMLATMLPGDKVLPLDDRPQSFIDRVTTKGGAKT
jgi:hypothetical protein